MWELLVDAEAVVVEGRGGLYIRLAGHHDDEDPLVVSAIGLWATGRRLKLSIRQTLALLRECTRRDLAEARTRLTPYSPTTYPINGPNMIEWGCAATTTLEDLVFTQLKIAETLGDLQVETEKIWILIWPDAKALWYTSVTKIDVFVNCWASGFSAAGGIHKWVMWARMDGPYDAAWLQALDEDAGLNAQAIHLQESCTFRVKNETKKFQCKLTGDPKLMMVTNGGGGGVLVGLPRCIGDYAHADCRVTNAFKKRLTKTITSLTLGVVGVRRIASEFADIWSTLLAYVKHVAPADRLFQQTTKAGQFDINTSMLFLLDPKYHVRIVHGLRNHFPNTMLGGVLMWTLIEVLLRNMCSLYALWRQKTPLTNGHVQEAKTQCRKIGEAWVRLGWKSTPWVHWTVAHCEPVLQKYRNLFVFSSLPAEHRHQPFKIAVKNSMRGRRLRRPRVSRRGLTHVLNMGTLDVGLPHRATR